MAIVLLAFTPWSSATAYTLTTIYSFCAQANCTDGQAPFGDLTMDASHNIFGATADGGDNQQGVLFELIYDSKTKSWSYVRLYSFCAQSQCADGLSPAGHLVVDTAGNLYGVARGGGPGQRGLAFELMRKGQKWKFKVLHQFCSEVNCSDGDGLESGFTYQGAASGVPYDGLSPLYGVTGEGGAKNYGVVYELIPRAKRWSEKVIYNLCSAAQCADGAAAGPAPVLDAAGNLYVATGFGGAHDDGNIFELSPKGKHGWKQTVLYSFCALANCVDGDIANELVMDGKGNLFGTTVCGGPNGCNGGTVFELTPHGAQSSYSVLYGFCALANCADGQQPQAGLTIDSAGNVFGTTFYGGGNVDQVFNETAGVAFEMQGSNLQVLHAFCSDANCTDGAFPYTNLIMDSSGNLFGMTEVGGKFDGGSVYVLSP